MTCENVEDEPVTTKACAPSYSFLATDAPAGMFARVYRGDLYREPEPMASGLEQPPLYDRASGLVMVPLPPERIGDPTRWQVSSTSGDRLGQVEGERESLQEAITRTLGDIEGLDLTQTTQLRLVFDTDARGSSLTRDPQSEWVLDTNAAGTGCESVGVRVDVAIPEQCGWRFFVESPKELTSDIEAKPFADTKDEVAGASAGHSVIMRTQLWLTPDQDIALFMTFHHASVNMRKLYVDEDDPNALQRTIFEDWIAVTVDYKIMVNHK